MNKIIVYTVIIGKCDDLKEIKNPSSEIDYICFTDQELKSNTWEIHKIPEEILNLEPKLQNKYLKMFPDKLFPDYEISLLCDANIEFIGDVNNFINSLDWEHYDMFFKKHPERDCIYDECDACVKYDREKKEVTDILKKKFTEEGMPKKYSLFECNFIVRKHNNSICKTLMNYWWKEVNNISKRDQLSFTYILWKHDLLKYIGVFTQEDIINRIIIKHEHKQEYFQK